MAGPITWTRLSLPKRRSTNRQRVVAKDEERSSSLPVGVSLSPEERMPGVDDLLGANGVFRTGSPSTHSHPRDGDETAHGDAEPTGRNRVRRCGRLVQIRRTRSNWSGARLIGWMASMGVDPNSEGRAIGPIEADFLAAGKGCVIDPNPIAIVALPFGT